MLALRMLNAGLRKRIDASQIKQELDLLTGSNGWVLGFLAGHEGEEIYQRDLEKELCICRSGISKIVAALEKNGLLERSRVASDDRLKKLILTEKGRQYTEQIRSDSRRLEAQLTAGFSAEELAVFHQALQRMQQNITNPI